MTYFIPDPYKTKITSTKVLQFLHLYPLSGRENQHGTILGIFLNLNVMAEKQPKNWVKP